MADIIVGVLSLSAAAAIAVLSAAWARVDNCSRCVWRLRGGSCGHRKASQVPEISQIQEGIWRCPWREVVRRERSI